MTKIPLLHPPFIYSTHIISSPPQFHQFSENPRSNLFRQNPFFSVPFLGLFVFLYFYIPIATTQVHFSVVVTKLVAHLRLSPSMGAVTLLALGDGAPDVFASVVAVRGGHPKTGFGAILSAGTFVSAFVVGFVSIYAAPFSLDPAPFVRDVMFLFYVYLSVLRFSSGRPSDFISILLCGDCVLDGFDRWNYGNRRVMHWRCVPFLSFVFVYNINDG